MSGIGWLPRTDQALNGAADYVTRVWSESHLVQRWMQMNAQGIAGAAEVRFASAMAQLRNASLVSGAGSLALTAGVPLAAWVAMFVALGAPYAEAEALVKNENFRSGYAQGFVAGLLKWEWSHVVSRFGKFSADFNAVDKRLGYIAANSRNEGTRSGFLMAWMLPDLSKKDWLSTLRSLSPGTSAGRWDRNDQISYVIELAAAGRRKNML